MRSSTLVLAFVMVLSSTGAFAQDPAPKPQDPAQKPPAAAGEAGVKPTRRFFPAFFHNLGDDVKHMPRKNSAFFLAGGGALALLVHPNDNKINRRLEGSGAAETFFKPGKFIGETPTIVGAGLAAYLIGRGKGNGRLQHLGMDELEASALSGIFVLGL